MPAPYAVRFPRYFTQTDINNVIFMQLDYIKENAAALGIPRLARHRLRDLHPGDFNFVNTYGGLSAQEIKNTVFRQLPSLLNIPPLRQLARVNAGLRNSVNPARSSRSRNPLNMSSRNNVGQNRASGEDGLLSRRAANVNSRNLNSRRGQNTFSGSSPYLSRVYVNRPVLDELRMSGMSRYVPTDLPARDFIRAYNSVNFQRVEELITPILQRTLLNFLTRSGREDSFAPEIWGNIIDVFNEQGVRYFMNNVTHAMTNMRRPLMTDERGCEVIVDMAASAMDNFVASQDYNNTIPQRTSTTLPPIAANGATLTNLRDNIIPTRTTNPWGTVSLPSINHSTLLRRELSEISNESSIDDGYKPPRLSVMPALFAEKLQDRSLHDQICSAFYSFCTKLGVSVYAQAYDSQIKNSDGSFTQEYLDSYMRVFPGSKSEFSHNGIKYRISCDNANRFSFQQQNGQEWLAIAHFSPSDTRNILVNVLHSSELLDANKIACFNTRNISKNNGTAR